MNVKANNPRATYILKEFWPRDWGFKKGDIAHTQLIYLQKFHTFLGVVEEEEKARNERVLGICTNIEERI